MDLPLITVITVVFNGEKILEQTIQSVVENPNKNINYIIVDGRSTDGTIDIIKKYQSKLFKWVSEPDKGIYDAMNKGWQLAPGNSYILFLGAGDKIVSLPQLTERSPDIIFGDVNKADKFIFHSTADIRLHFGNTVHHQALLIKKKIHPQQPFDLNYPVYADFDFNQRLLKKGYRFVKDENFLSYAHDAGASADFKKDEVLAIVKKNFGRAWVALAKTYYFLQKIYYRFKYGKTFV